MRREMLHLAQTSSAEAVRGRWTPVRSATSRKDATIRLESLSLGLPDLTRVCCACLALLERLLRHGGRSQVCRQAGTAPPSEAPRRPSVLGPAGHRARPAAAGAGPRPPRSPLRSPSHPALCRPRRRGSGRGAAPPRPAARRWRRALLLLDLLLQVRPGRWGCRECPGLLPPARLLCSAVAAGRAALGRPSPLQRRRRRLLPPQQWQPRPR